MPGTAISPTAHSSLLPSATARMGLAEPGAFWGESLIFQGRLDTLGLALITGTNPQRQVQKTRAYKTLQWSARVNMPSLPMTQPSCF